ncbi:MAG: MATE family efflux transporter [Candidatus Ornithospirochaeta sp.]|nr:MATE family efflux transporter [Candidatus Ornithospirochaeta sp.]
MKRNAEVMRMTEGTPWKCILLFSLPLMIGNLFQQLYNTVDSIVVGNYIGKEALAAVGSVDPIISTFIGFFSGLSAGAGVVISQYFGAKQDRNVSESVHSTVAITLLLSVVLTVLSQLLTPAFLEMLGTPDDVWPEASRYLRIYFMGVTGQLIYNMGAGILRAVGDSRRPLFFLIFSALTNTILDIIFVAILRFGVEGAAYATIISQALSAILVAAILLRERGSFRIEIRKIRIYPERAVKIIRIGMPTALQMMITSFSNVFIQSYINHFGSAAMAGWSSYSKIDKFCLLPLQSIGLGITTFAGQNLGAGKIERTNRGIKDATLMNFITAVVLIIILWVLAPQLVYLFNKDEDVIYYGTLFLRTISPFFICNSFNLIHNGALKGAGNTKIPMIVTMSCFIAFRQAYLFVVSRLTDSIYAVAMGYPLGWLLNAIILAIYYRHIDLGKYVITGRTGTKSLNHQGSSPS